MPSKTVEIDVTFNRPNDCAMMVDGKKFSLPSHEKEAEIALRREAGRFSNAIVRGGLSIPYKCFGSSVFLAQQAGFQRVGFIAEPPPKR